MRYLQGIAVAALIVVGYLVMQGGLTAAPPALPSPTATVRSSSLGAVAPPATVITGPLVLYSPVPLRTRQPISPHVFHSGPPLH